MKLITFPNGATKLHFIFGPYRDRVPGTFGVRLTEDHQLDLPCDLHFPIRDFSTPSCFAFENLLIDIITKAQEGKVVYVGCYGGIGRTGMVVAGLARVLVVGSKPVLWAREHYLSHAVETEPQERLVSVFDVNRVREAMFQGPVAAQAPTTNSVPALKKELQPVALWDKVKAYFGNARRQAGDYSRK